MTTDTPKPRSLERREQRAKHSAGLAAIKRRWVTREDYETLQPQIDAAAERAKGDGNDGPS